MEFAMFLIAHMQMGSAQGLPLFSASMVQLDAVYEDYDTCNEARGKLDSWAEYFWADNPDYVPGMNRFIYACAPIPKQ